MSEGGDPLNLFRMYSVVGTVCAVSVRIRCGFRSRWDCTTRNSVARTKRHIFHDPVQCSRCVC